MPDHHAFKSGDLNFGDNLPVLMTEKDAVKCAAFADERCWYVPVTAEFAESEVERARSIWCSRASRLSRLSRDKQWMTACSTSSPARCARVR